MQKSGRALAWKNSVVNFLFRLMLSTWMARLGVKTLLLDANHEPVQRGHADGLDPRTFEILDSFDMADSICKVANPTLEMGIWVRISRYLT